MNGGPAPHDGVECWAKGMGEFDVRSSWLAPCEVPHITWGCIANGTAIFSSKQLAVLILDLYLGLTSMYPTKTSSGALTCVGRVGGSRVGGWRGEMG